MYRTSKFGAEFILGALYQFLIDIPDSIYSTTALFVNLTNKVFTPYSDLSIPYDAVDNAAEYYLEDRYLNQTFAFRAGRVAGDLVSLGFGILEMIAGTAIATGGSIGGGILSATGLGAIVGVPATAVSLAAGGALTTHGAVTAADALGDIHDNIIDMMAMVNSGNNPIKSINRGSPVPGVPGGRYDKSKFTNTDGQPEALDFEITATGKGQANKDLAVYAKPDSDTEFDWHDGSILIDAKYWQGNKNPLHPDFDGPDFMTDRVFKQGEVLDKTKRQLDAISRSNFTGIEWRVADSDVAAIIRDILEDANRLLIRDSSGNILPGQSRKNLIDILEPGQW